MYHRSLELWKLIKTFMFKDGRLWRVGGDSRVRYCYCQDYVIPMLMFVQDHFGDKDAKWLSCGRQFHHSVSTCESPQA